MHYKFRVGMHIKTIAVLRSYATNLQVDIGKTGVLKWWDERQNTVCIKFDDAELNDYTRSMTDKLFGDYWELDSAKLARICSPINMGEYNKLDD